MNEAKQARVFTLGHLTVERLAPPEMVAQAAKAGFSAIGLRFWDGFTNKESYPLWPGSPMLRETRALLAEVGVAVPEIENIVLRPETRADEYRRMFETGATLGAKRVIIGSVVDDEALCTEIFASLCEGAAEFDLDIALEFYMKWHGCASIAQGRRIIANAGQKNGKLLVDALHLDRSGGSAADVAAMPPDYLASMQLCDAPAAKPKTLDEISFESRFFRLMPGEGGLALKDLLKAFPADLPLGIEIPNRALEDSIGSQAFLEQCFQSTTMLLSETDVVQATARR